MDFMPRRPSPRFPTLRLLVTLICAYVLAACGSPTDVTAVTTSTTTSTEVATTTQTPTTTAPTTTTSAPSTTTTSAAAALPSLDDLQAIVDTTVELPRLSFELTADSTLGETTKNRLTRTGWFDDGSLTGDGVSEITTTADFVDPLPPFEFRLVDYIFWTLTPVGDPSVWIGRDVFEMTEQEGDPTGSIDGDAHLWLIMEAATRVTDYNDDGNGTQHWQLDVSADLKMFSFSGGGAAQRIVDAGGGDTGIIESLRLTVTNGIVTEAFVDLSTWWNEAIRISNAAANDLPPLLGIDEALLSMSFAPYEDARLVETPCVDPTLRSEDGIEYLRC